MTFSIFSKHDIPTLHEVFVEKVYDSLFTNLPLNPRTIVDIGANIGCFAVLAKKKFPGAHVVSYEAFSTNWEKLKENTARNGVDVTCVNLAVAGVSGTRTLQLSDTSGKHRLVGDGDGVQVQCVTLDSIIETYRGIDLLKIDIEGAEAEVLENSGKLNRVKRIALEFHGNEESLTDLLQSRGFRSIGSITHNVQVFENSET